MTLRTQASLGKGLKEVEKDDFNMNNLFLATITKVNYKYQTVELRTKYTYAGRNIGSKGEFSAPFPKSFIGRTPEGALFGDNNIIVPGSIALVGFLEGDAGQPFIINVYGYPNDNKMLTPNPLESGDINNREIYKYGSMIHQINPSLTYSYLDGEGTYIKSFNGKSFLSVTSQEDERPLATDFYTGTEYEDLYTSYYGDGSEVEPRNQIAPNVLLKHRGEYTHDGEEDNHITTLHLTEKGAVRVSVMNTETQERTTQEMDENGNYRVIYQGDELLLDEAQVWVEYGINKDTKSFYIKNENQEFEFTDEGVLINGTPLIDNLDESLQEAFEQLKVIQKDLEDINSLLEGAGKENLEELIRTAKESIEASGQASRDVEKLRGDISTVSQRVEGNIKKLDDYMKTMDDFVEDTNAFITRVDSEYQNFIQEFRTFKNDFANIPERVKNVEDKLTVDNIYKYTKDKFISNKSNIVLVQDKEKTETIPTIIVTTEDIRSSLGSNYEEIKNSVINELTQIETEEDRLTYIKNNLMTLNNTNLKKLVGNKEYSIIIQFKDNNNNLHDIITTNYKMLYNNDFIPLDTKQQQVNIQDIISKFKLSYSFNEEPIEEFSYTSTDW